MSKIILLTFLIAVSLTICINGVSLNYKDGAAWTGGRNINPTFSVMWRYDDDNNDITFKIQATATGYVALGITNSGSMKNADIYIGWVKDGVAHIKDTHGPAEDNGKPSLDESQDVELVSGEQANGVTTITFRRKLTTCDDKDIDITSNTVKMIWAHSSSEPSGDDLTDALYHGRDNRGHFNTYLLVDKPIDPPLPADSFKHEMRLKNITIPNSDTTYWCDWFKIDRNRDLDGKKHHLIKNHIIIGGHGQSNHPYVHHLILYRCNDLPSDWSEEEEREGGGPCFDGTSRLRKSCGSDQELIAAWAVGGEPFYFPGHVGLPIGEKELEYYLIEMHFDNPAMESGVIDNSGIELTLTPTLRQHEAGTLFTGMRTFFWMFIPPKLNEFRVEGFCHPNCTKHTFSSDGVKAFAGFLHTHLLGRQVTARHFRDGKELPYILQDTNYDFNYQDMIPLTEEREILPGDSLSTVCVYNSMSRDDVTYAGLSTREEMCITFLFYYPKSPLFICDNMLPLPEYIGPALGVDTFYENPDYYNATLNKGFGPIVDVDGVNMTWTDFLDQREWTEQDGRAVERLGLSESRLYTCGTSEAINGNLLLDEWQPPINVTETYIPPTPAPCFSLGSKAQPPLHLYIGLVTLLILFSRFN